MNAKHTPSPWNYDPDDDYHNVHSRAYVTDTALATVAVVESGAACKANALLIAAAPDLLAACELVAQVLKTMPTPRLGEWNWPEITSQINAAVAKANGGAE